MQKLFAKWVPKCLNADQKRQLCQSSEQLLEFFRRDSNDFLSGAIGDNGWNLVISLWPGDKTTINGVGGIAAHPALKNSKCKNPLEKFSPRYFGIKKASSSLIIFQRTRLSTRSITHLCWCNWRTFWRRNDAGISPRESCSCTTMPRLIGHLQPRRNWPTWTTNVLITHTILRIWPRRTTKCSLDWKKQLKSRHFLSDAEVIAAAETWFDGQLSDFFLSGLQQLDQWAKECIELRGEYVE